MIIRKCSSVALLALPWVVCGAALAQDGLTVTVELPDVESWTELTNQVVGDSYNREWVPRGYDSESTAWLVAQQKLPLDEDVSAKEFLEHVYELLAMACTSTQHDDPKRHRVDGVRGTIGRTLCAQRLGTDYGVFSDQLVFVEDGFAYIVTSEVRTPPMHVAGVLSFDSGTPEESREAARRFREHDELSRTLIRERVSVED